MSSHDDTRKGGRVYCIQAEDGGPVKIGVTTEPIHRRLSKIQTSSPVPLVVRRLIEFATYDEARQHERDMHQRFAEDRVGGEWFHPSLGVALFADVEPEDACPDAATLDRWAGIADLWARGVTREVIADMLGRPQYALRRECPRCDGTATNCRSRSVGKTTAPQTHHLKEHQEWSADLVVSSSSDPLP